MTKAARMNALKIQADQKHAELLERLETKVDAIAKRQEAIDKKLDKVLSSPKKAEASKAQSAETVTPEKAE